MKISNYFILGWVMVCSISSLHAQNYSAVHGSNYFGSLSVYNNPSSIISSPYKWDLTIFGTQFTTISNAVQGKNFPLYLSPDAVFKAANGNFERKADINTNLHLFNARYSIDQDHALAFGLNFRTYTQATTSPINYTDSVIGPRSFLLLNEQNKEVNLNMASSAWMELYGSYALTLWNRTSSRLNIGATIKILRSMSGVYARVNDVGIEKIEDNDQTLYKIVQGSAKYAYSANHGLGDSFEAGDLFEGSQTSFSGDIGIEYTVKSQAVTSVFDEAGDIDYEWKIGFSLLDIGWNKFLHGTESRFIAALKGDVTNLVLQEKFTAIKNVAEFNDSLTSIVDRSDMLGGSFYIFNPARAVINVDRYMWGNFYLNGELSFNLLSNEKENVVVKETKLITITPRWETRKFGLYFPVQYTRHGNFWMGAAVKAGPLLLGTHNLLNAFAKNKDLSGGAYLAITIHPFNLLRNKDARSRQYECPTY